MMKISKSKFVKSAISILLVVMMLLSAGMSSIIAATVDMAQTGVDHSGGYIYFDNSVTNWTDSYIYLVIGHDGYSSVYRMTKIENTNLYYYPMGSWSGATYCRILGNSTVVESGSWGSGNTKGATHYTNVYNDWTFQSGNTYVITPSSSSNNCGINISYKGNGYSELNSNQTVGVKVADYGSSSYNEATDTGISVSASTYQLNGNGTSTTSSGATAAAVKTANVELSYTNVPDGYTFKGWYNESGTQVGTGSTYSYTANGAAKYYAHFEKKSQVGAGSSYYIHYGIGNDWKDTEKLKYTDTENVVSLTLDNLTAGTYKFKITDGTTWYTNDTTINDTCKDLDFSTTTGYDNNCKLEAKGGTYTFAFNTKDKKLTVTKAVDEHTVSITNTGENGTITAGGKEITGASGEVNVENGKTLSLTVTPKSGYYVSAITGAGISYTAKAGTVNVETSAITNSDQTIIVTYTKNPKVTVTQAGGTVKVNDAVYSEPVAVAYKSTPTVVITAPTGYYISGISVNGTPKNIDTVEPVTYPINDLTVDGDKTIIVTYTERTTYTVTVGAYDSSKGTLRFGGQDIPAAGKTYNVYKGDTFTIEAVSNGNYTVSKWVVNNSDVEASGNYAVQSADKNYTISVEWKELSSFTVAIDANPYAGGTATGTVTKAASGSSGSISSDDRDKLSTEIEEGGNVTLTANAKSGYKFSRWQISGSYKIVSGNLNSEDLVITPTGNVTIVAVFDKSARRIYLENAANWGTPYAYVFGGSASDAWPGDKMTYDSTLGYWYRDVPVDFKGVVFSVGNDTAKVQYDGVLSTQNLFTNASDRTGYPKTYVEEGIYLQGTWNSNNYSAYDLVKFSEERGGIYTLSINVTATDADGYIYVNPTDKDSKYYNAESAEAVVGNSVTLITPPVENKTNAVKIHLDMTASLGGYRVTFTFNKTTGEFSWVATPKRETITVNGTNGSISGAGNTYFDVGGTVVSTTPLGSYAEASVVVDEYFTIYTQINTANNSETDLTYEWYVAGYVINGTKFVSATALGNGKYSADIRLSAADDGADIVPIYFHTKEYRAHYKINTTTFYVVIPDGVENWTDTNNYIGAYTWYYKPGTTQNIYSPFGKYPGQLLIPITGLDNVYYTIVETSAPTKGENGETIYVNGVTLTNYNSTSPSNESNVNVQTYDYYEFVSYTLQKRENITFVLKEHNQKNYNNQDKNETSVDLNTFDFIPFTNYNNQITNVFGKVMTEADYKAKVEAGDVIHAVRVGNRNYLVSNGSNNCGMTHKEGTTCPLNGEWYVDIYFYDNNGNYITKCHSYQLSNGEMKNTLGQYEGYAVKVSYETDTKISGDGGVGTDNGEVPSPSTRWDGEWYADTDNTVTVDISVNVALSTDNGKTWTHAKDLDGNYVNTAAYGTALVNNLAVVSVTRGGKVNLLAQIASGYRFIGWATADGTIFSKNISETVDVAISTSYTAVYQKLASDMFYLNHYLYKGNGTAPEVEIPDAHNGRGDLYVQIEKLDRYGNVIADTGFVKANTVELSALEGDILRITIATDPSGIDHFYAWYVGADGASGTTYEEVGVDSFDNMAMPGYVSDGVFNPTYTNRGTTVVGSKDMVYYQFMYTVGTQFNLTLYSDIIRETANKTLIYTYNDRGMGIKKYYVNIELTPEEILNNYTPSEETISKYAPFVGDYYKDIQWVLKNFDKSTCELFGTNLTKYYTVTTVIDGAVSVTKVPYNTQFIIDASEYGFSKGGFWYQETNTDNPDGYTEGVDPIIANGTWYSYVVTKDMVIGYKPTKINNFNVSLDAPVYGREQSTDSSGNNKVDKVLVDYVVNMVTPFVYGDGNGFEYSFGGNGTDKNMTGNMVTIESLTKKGYKVTFGILVEQVGSFAVKEPYGDTGKYAFDTYKEAEAAARDKGFGVATDSSTLSGYIQNRTFGMQNGKFYINYEQNMNVLSNKNRYRFLLELNNTASYRKAFYNVYAYMTVTAPGESVAKTYISNVQTLNIYPTVLTNATPV